MRGALSVRTRPGRRVHRERGLFFAHDDDQKRACQQSIFRGERKSGDRERRHQSKVLIYSGDHPLAKTPRCTTPLPSLCNYHCERFINAALPPTESSKTSRSSLFLQRCVFSAAAHSFIHLSALKPADGMCSCLHKFGI